MFFILLILAILLLPSLFLKTPIIKNSIFNGTTIHTELKRTKKQDRIFRHNNSPSPSQKLTQEKLSQSLQAFQPKSKTTLAPELAWERFKEKFGSELEADFSSLGSLLEVRNLESESSPVQKSLKLLDQQGTVERAKEVLDSINQLELHRFLETELWSVKSVLLGDLSSQVYFEQSWDGLRVLPDSYLKVDLGTEGKLLGLTLREPRFDPPHNSFQISEAQAKAITRRYLDYPDHILFVPESVAQVIWVSSKKASRAYQVQVRGHEVLVDGENGDVLFFKNHRQY